MCVAGKGRREGGGEGPAQGVQCVNNQKACPGKELGVWGRDGKKVTQKEKFGKDYWFTTDIIDIGRGGKEKWMLKEWDV